MSNDIKQVITESIESKHGVGVSSYDQYITTAADAVAEREYAIFEHLVQVGTDLSGKSEEQVSAQLEATGLCKRPAPEPVMETVTDEGEDMDVQATLKVLMGAVNKLTEAARARGLVV